MSFPVGLTSNMLFALHRGSTSTSRRSFNEVVGELSNLLARLADKVTTSSIVLGPGTCAVQNT